MGWAVPLVTEEVRRVSSKGSELVAGRFSELSELSHSLWVQFV